MKSILFLSALLVVLFLPIQAEAGIFSRGCSGGSCQVAASSSASSSQRERPRILRGLFRQRGCR